MKDFLGNEFGVGDLIVYPKMSGRSVCLVKGRVLKFNPTGSISIQPETESWNGGRERSGNTRYLDTRTGKYFDPWAEKNAEHLVRQYGRMHKATGEYMDTDKWYAMIRAIPGGWSAQRDEQEKWEWCDRIFKDHVKEETKIKPVTITRTDNVILVPGG